MSPRRPPRGCFRDHDLARFAERFAIGSLVEMALGQGGTPRRLEGREAILQPAGRAAWVSGGRTVAFSDIVRHLTSDP